MGWLIILQIIIIFILIFSLMVIKKKIKDKEFLIDELKAKLKLSETKYLILIEKLREKAIKYEKR